MSHLENEIGDEQRLSFESHSAEPAKIVEIVVSLKSTNAEVPRTLSDTLMEHLQQIADSNSGHVPVHGRLFAQWMHHAFPRECQFPNTADSSQTPAQWGPTARLSEEEMLNYLDSSATEFTGFTTMGAGSQGQQKFEDSELAWGGAEEVMFSHGMQQPPQKPNGFARKVFVFGTLMSMAYAAKSLLLDGCDGLGDSKVKMV